MSLSSMIVSLLSDVTDPAVRSDISTTIFFLRGLYLSGKISEGELRSEIKNVVKTVLEFTHPEMLPDEIEKRSDELTGQIVRVIKLEALRSRTILRHSLSPSGGP